MNRAVRPVLTLSCAVALALMLSGCGLKGPLDSRRRKQRRLRNSRASPMRLPRRAQPRRLRANASSSTFCSTEPDCPDHVRKA